MRLDVHFVSSVPVERHARVGGHPVPVALVPWIPACAGMTQSGSTGGVFMKQTSRRVRRIPWDVDCILATAPPAVLQVLAQIVGHQKLLEAIGGGVAQDT